ncbi:MAG: zinc-binding alcohol dehydrogenase family protein [Akkermansiaceae bacterium]|jgi:NADPH2:quinone reductase|nr:zinc-binding alcohol dehydrogenase family protein [Akkermansiaceae bacterium]
MNVTNPMKAIGARSFLPVTAADCLVEFAAEKPVPGPLDLLVRVRAAAVNPVDTKIRASLGAGPHEPPRILGWDAAGTVEAAGADVRGFAPGDEVFYAGDLTRPGCNAEFQAVDSRLVAHKPKSWSFTEAAAVPLCALTAWELLFERMGVDPTGRDTGKALLVINGAGGVGSALIPIARGAGLTVVATASRPATSAWCRSLGAHHVINHREPLRPQAEALGIASFPYIANLFNTEAYWETTADLIAPFGALGLIVEPREKLNIGDPLKAKCARIVWEFMAARARFKSPDMHVQGEYLAEIARRCDDGTFPKIHTRVLDRLTVENLRQAHAAMEQGSAHGKWVIGM